MSSAPLVLVVDDESINLQVVGAALVTHGFRVGVALDGASALEAAHDALPDVILLDVMMPLMDGFAVCRALKADPRTSMVPVLFLTAHTDRASVHQGFQVGGADYVAKPFEIEELIARVRVHAELKRLRGLLSMCSFCHRIKNEHDEWEAVHTYITRHTGTLFSHGLCAECAAEHYPDVR